MKKKKVIRINKSVLPEKEPIVINISGNIDSVANWLAKRVVQSDEGSDEQLLPEGGVVVNPVIATIPLSDNMIDQKEAHVLINRDKMSIDLIVNEINPFLKGKVSGTLAKHPDFEKWAINTGQEWSNRRMSEFVKMNRSCFTNKEDAMKLSAELQSLKVKVDKEVESSNDNRANIRSMMAQKVIDMNIPKSFMLNVPIFKGGKKVKFEVEIYVNPGTFDISLISPDANDVVSEVKETVIDEQKEIIIGLAPDLVIIEQ